MAQYDIESSGSVIIDLTKTNDSIDLKHGEPFMSVVTASAANQIKENQTKIGNGDKIVTLKYDNLTLGPVYAKDEDEVRIIFVLFKDELLRCY